MEKDKFTSEFTKDYSSFSFVNYDEDNKEFRFLMTQEIQAILNEELENTEFRIFPGSFFGSSIERIIFSGANSSSKNKTRLIKRHYLAPKSASGGDESSGREDSGRGPARCSGRDSASFSRLFFF